MFLWPGPAPLKPTLKLDYEDVFKQSSETNTTVYCGNLPNEALTEGIMNPTSTTNTTSTTTTTVYCDNLPNEADNHYHYHRYRLLL